MYHSFVKFSQLENQFSRPLDAAVHHRSTYSSVIQKQLSALRLSRLIDLGVAYTLLPTRELLVATRPD